MQIATPESWYRVERLSDGVTLISEQFIEPYYRCNIWHVRGRGRDLLIDTGMGISSLKEATRHLIDKPVLAVATHTHADHIGGHHEFDDCLVHRIEAEGLKHPSARNTLIADDFDPADLRKLRIAGYEIEGSLIAALPHDGYDLRSYRVRGARPTRTVEEGDVVDTGDRRFEVLHLPGHSPGSIGLWEERTGILFSGDAIYDGPLLDELHHSSIADYIRTMRRLRGMPVRVVHAGHDPSFGRDRLVELVDAYLRRRDPGYGATAAA